MFVYNPLNIKMYFLMKEIKGHEDWCFHHISLHRGFVGNEEKWKWAASKLTVSNNSVLDLLLSGKSEQIQSFFSLTDCVQHKRTFYW